MIPSIPQDIDTLINNSILLFKYLPIKNIYVIGPEAVAERLTAANDSRFIFMNENELVDVPRVRKLYSSRTEKNPGRAGWYIQQFIKMLFARFTQDEYYLIWDSDTIPLKPVNIFDDADRPFFDMKTEYHVPYFETMNRIIPDLHKTAKGSFISEHMLIKTEYMRELLNEIEDNSTLEGLSFQEKIINAIDVKDLSGSGFSEYETFGTYVIIRHHDSYIMRDWHSLRSGKRFYSSSSAIDEENIIWLSGTYDAISLEKGHTQSRLSFIVKTKLFHILYSPSVLENLSVRRKVRTFFKRLIGMKKGA